MKKSSVRNGRSDASVFGKGEQKDITVQNKDRLARIAEELGQMRLVTETERTGILSDVEHRLRIMDDRLNEGQEEFNRRYNNLRDLVGEIQKSFDEDKADPSRSFDIIFEEIELMKSKLQELYEKERQKRREYENRVEVTFSERYTGLKDELSKENEEMSTGISQITEIYESDLQKLHQSLSDEISARQEVDTKLTNEINAELAKLHENVNTIKQTRDESEDKLNNKIKDAVDKMKEGMAEERATREKNHSNMIDLLEQACKNLRERAPEH